MTASPMLLDAHERYGLPVGFTEDGDMLVTGGFDGSLACWALPDGDAVAKNAGHDQSVNSGAITADGALVTGSTDTTVRVWELPDLTHLTTLTGHSKTVAGVATHPDAPLVVSGAYDATVRAWDLTTESDTAILRGHQGNVTSVAFVNRGTNVVSGGLGDEALVWDISEDIPVARFTGHDEATIGVAAGPAGEAWTVAYSGRIRRWEPEEWTVAASFDIPSEGRPTGLEINQATGAIAVTVEGGVLHLDSDGGLIEEYSLEIKGVSTPRWSLDGERLAVGGADGTVRIFA